MTEIPPSRWRVVEKGRRLVVIDTTTGEAATREPPVTPAAMGPESGASRLPSGPQRTSFDGRATLVTHSLYDSKAPRTIDLPPSAVAAIGWLKIAVGVLAALVVAALVFEPWLLVFPALLAFQPRLFKALRGAATRWLDGYDVHAKARRREDEDSGSLGGADNNR